MLSSPGFVFVEEKPGRLDDHALATRLALFLWNSIPDDTLRALADRGELRQPEVLRAQTERMLADPKARRFVEAFTDYWLDLRKIDDTSPSTTLYNDYELDDPLKLAAMEETRLFFAELLRADLPARNIVDSDFTFLNERLADHYGIRGVTGVDFRKVTLPADSLRGGLMTQASVLKVTANGTTTSPVLRGHWITERILGLETPPPPPSVEAVEPDIRGAVTIRQQLEKHRADASCAACHSKMDPPGFALESFDVMGGFRDRYRAVSDKVPPVKGFGMNGQAFAFHYALPVDSAGELPNGQPFKDVRELKRLLVQDEAADRPQPGPAVDGLRHRRAGAVLRPGGDRENPRRGQGPASTACAASSTRSCRASCSGTSRKDGDEPQTGPIHGPFASSDGRSRGGASSAARPWRWRCRFWNRCAAPFARASRREAAPRRMFCICNNLGLLPEPFFPKDAGRDYTPSPYLKLLQEHRADFTVLSGVSHPNVDGGHPSDISFLTAAPHPASSSFRNSISLDQLVAERIGTLTRFPSLTLAVNGGRSLSWTRTGVAIPPEDQASGVFNQLFLQGTPAEIEAQIRELDTGRSILDAVADQAKDLQRNVGARDRSRLDQYFSSVRDLEHRLQESRGWANKPKPTVKASPPIDPASPAQYMAKVQGHVRPGAAGLRDRFDPRDHADAQQRRHAGRADRRRDDHRQLSQPVAPRHGRGEADAAQGDRRMAHEAAGRPVHTA